MLIKTGYLHIKFPLLQPLEDRPRAWLHRPWPCVSKRAANLPGSKSLAQTTQRKGRWVLHVAFTWRSHTHTHTYICSVRAGACAEPPAVSGLVSRPDVRERVVITKTNDMLLKVTCDCCYNCYLPWLISRVAARTACIFMRCTLSALIAKFEKLLPKRIDTLWM